MKRLIPLVCLLSFASSAFAVELPHFFEGVRPLGMGGAFTAVADDENALFYNPAGLSRVEEWGMGLINPLIESSENSYDFSKEAEDTDFDSDAEVVQLLRNNLGETMHVRAAVFPHFVMPNFAIGALGQVKANLEARNPAFPEMAVDAIATASGHVGYGHGFDKIEFSGLPALSGTLRIGGGAKYVSASKYLQIYDAADIADPNFEDQVEDDKLDGSGFGLDVGAMYTLDLPLAPTLGLTILNVADTDLGEAGELPQQINIGVSISHDFGIAKVTGAADYLDLTDELEQDSDSFKHIHMGVEAKFKKILSLRAGLSQGYGSFGAGLDFKLLKIEYANYAEELSSFAGGKVDRRHVAQVSLGW